MKPSFYRIDSVPDYYIVISPKEDLLDIIIIGEDFKISLGGTWKTFDPLGKKVSFNDLPPYVLNDIAL